MFCVRTFLVSFFFTSECIKNFIGIFLSSLNSLLLNGSVSEDIKM